MSAADIYIDDLAVGRVFDLGSVRVGKEEMLEYARRYDPQPMHVDEEEAKLSSLGGLIASGWLTASLAMKLLSGAQPYGRNPILGIGVDTLRWPNPVRPEDVLSGKAEVIAIKQPSPGKARGVVRLRSTFVNQNDEIVLQMEPLMVLPRAP